MSNPTPNAASPLFKAQGVVQFLSPDWADSNPINRSLKLAGYTVDYVRGQGGELAALGNKAANAAIIDLWPSTREALTALEQLRTAGWRTPVLILLSPTETGSANDCLEAGADQYLAKPFSEREFLARVRVLAWRGSELSRSSLKVGDLVLDGVTRKASRAGKSITLTRREFDLLLHFMSCPGKVCERTAILANVWGYSSDPGTNIVDVYVRKLRDKIDHGHPQKLIQSVRGIGYSLQAP